MEHNTLVREAKEKCNGCVILDDVIFEDMELNLDEVSYLFSYCVIRNVRIAYTTIQGRTNKVTLFSCTLDDISIDDEMCMNLSDATFEISVNPMGKFLVTDLEG